MTNTHNTSDNVMTVADLIARLQTFDPALPMQMAMNQEYQWAIRTGDVQLVTDDTRTGPYVLIGE